MTSNFASLSLARLYEKQGYIDDALETYKAIDTSQYPDGALISEAICRLEAHKKVVESKGNDHDGVNSNPVQGGSKEVRMAHLLEVWVRLIVMQKRTAIFKTIKARL